VYGSDEQARFYAFQLPLGLSGLSLLLAPGAVVLLCCRFAAYAKQNWDLFMLYMGILFSVFVLLTPPAPGYFLWSLPFLIHFMCREKRANPLPYYVYAATYLTFFWMGSQSDLFDAWRVVIPSVAYWKAPYQALAALMPERAAVAGNFIFTVMEISLAGLILQMYLFGVRSNAVYFMRARPILIGLAGDSGAGKDTFTRCIQDVMGRQRVDVIAGDDYHRWPRGHEMWQVYTHLNVRGNDLHRQQEHSIALSGGSSVIKGTYDHATGEFTEEKVVDPGQMIVFQGLHSLSIEGMRSLYDLKIFLDPDEELRRRWKVQRDGDERGRAPEEVLQDIENRQKDRGRYILPQMEQADLIFRWVPAGESSPGSPEGLPEMALELKAINSINLLDLSMRLSAVQTLGVEHEPFLDTRWQWMKIRGTITREQLEGIAQESIPNLDEIAPGASFLADLPGCRQLMFIACLSYKLQWLGQSYQKRGFLTG
jgi:uridine kinase